ncbi:MAG: hypothetical protein WC007_19120 [Pelobacteraceae bacterium]
MTMLGLTPLFQPQNLTNRPIYLLQRFIIKLQQRSFDKTFDINSPELLPD